MNLLFFRGEWDKNNKKNFNADTDMWVQLWREMVGDDNGALWYKGSAPKLEYKGQPVYIQDEVPDCSVDTVFARGGFDYYVPALKKYGNAFKIYYGAGARIKPKDNIKYGLVLVDTPEQKRQLKDDYNARLWIKPAANNFKPEPVKKEYDVCYIANPSSENQAEFKRIKWVYKTAPSDLKILHLGNSWKYKKPDNVTVKQLSREEMPQWISKCRVGICPYKKYDSAPRALIEMNACGVPVVCLEVNIWHDVYATVRADINSFWGFVKEHCRFEYATNNKFYTVKFAADFLKEIICQKKE